MDDDHDVPLYVEGMADWLDDDNQPHPLRFERAFHGLENHVGPVSGRRSKAVR